MELRSPLLDVLTADERGRLLDRAVVREVDRGEHIYLAGEHTSRVHLVMSGVVKLGARDLRGNETILGLVLPGSVLGDIAALDGLGQPVDAVATEPCRLMGVDAESFADVIAGNSRAAMEVLRQSHQLLRWLFDTTLERTTGEVTGRLAGRLLGLADIFGIVRDGAVELDLPMPQSDLGRLSGMCRESACKTLRSFKRRGLVDYEGRRLRILRPDALEKIRCAGRAGEPFQ